MAHHDDELPEEPFPDDVGGEGDEGGEEGNGTNGDMVDVILRRIILSDGADRQYIYISDKGGKRGFPIVIGTNEAYEIQRVVEGKQPQRPLTHQLTFESIRALGATLKNVDIVDLRQNTFYAHVVLQNEAGDVLAVVDARPSDAIALALRARCPIRCAESVLERAAVELPEPDVGEGPEEPEGEEPDEPKGLEPPTP